MNQVSILSNLKSNRAQPQFAPLPPPSLGSRASKKNAPGGGCTPPGPAQEMRLPMRDQRSCPGIQAALHRRAGPDHPAHHPDRGDRPASRPGHRLRTGPATVPLAAGLRRAGRDRAGRLDLAGLGLLHHHDLRNRPDALVAPTRRRSAPTSCSCS